MEKELTVHIRWMIRRDMPETLKMESESFEFPWSEEDFLRCLQQRNCIGMVAEHDEKVIGYMIYELQKKRLYLLNFTVDCAYRRRRVGTQMAGKLARKLSPQRRNHIALEIRETNLGGQLFFRAAGFRATKILRGWYVDSTEDAYAMRYNFASVQTINRISKCVNIA